MSENGKNVDQCFPAPKMTFTNVLLLSKTKRCSVYYHKVGKKPENIYK